MSLKQLIKQAAYDLGADLVGFGSVSRCKHAPIMMSPQGLMPNSKTVIVMAIHHPDACIELGGETHSQEIGPYSVQYLMNSRLDEMSYRLASFIEKSGYEALPIASSNIWRYNQYKDLKAIFAPDISHIYMAVVTGLADMGFNGLAITPEYGARNRFITILTDAEIESDPLIDPGTLCDGCMLCRKHCPSGALSKEVKGENVLKIDDYEYKFANKNLWRCAWGEHFDLDLDLEIPEKVDEQVILEKIAKYGKRGGEMGQCLKFCVPGKLRSFDTGYSCTPMRKYDTVCDAEKLSRGEIDKILSQPFARGCDEVVVSSVEELSESGVDIDKYLPGAKSAVTLIVNAEGQSSSDEFKSGAQHQIDSVCYDLTREFERLGYRSLMTIKRDDKENPASAILQSRGISAAEKIINTVITRLPIASQHRKNEIPVRIDRGNAAEDLTSHIKKIALDCGFDLAGSATAETVNKVCDQLKGIYDGNKLLVARDEAIAFSPWKPQVTEQMRKVQYAADLLDNAKSVLVLGHRLHGAVLENATKPPAEAVGPYCFQSYVTSWLNTIAGYRVVQRLRDMGFKAVMTTDLSATASKTASPRSELPDLFANRFAAVAAGLGWLSVSGHLTTNEFGIRQRVIAIVTDAPLAQGELKNPDRAENLCSGCEKYCVSACPAKAFENSEQATISCGDYSYSYLPTDPMRCDWSKRYALQAESGFGYLGNPADIEPPKEIKSENLIEALGQHDPIKKYRPVIAEPCVLKCPLHPLRGGCIS